MPRLVFAISGASGMPLAEALLAQMTAIGSLDVHLIISQGALAVMQAEKGGTPEELARGAGAVYSGDDLAAPPASGSWFFDGMVVCPCSTNTLAAVAGGFGGTLIQRAAQVALKERRRLILAVRETPLSLPHLRNMAAVTEAGGIIMPFMPAFYAGGYSMREAMRQFAGHVLDLLGIANDLRKRWRS